MREAGDEDGSRAAWKRAGGKWDRDGRGADASGRGCKEELGILVEKAMGGASDAFGSEGDLLRKRCAKALCERGAMLAMAGDAQGGAACFKAAIAADPSDGDAKAALEMTLEMA